MIDNLIIKDVIKRHGTSVNEVAERMGISRITLSTHINGNPSVEVLNRIAKAIGCPVGELFKDNKPEQANIITCPKCGTKIPVEVNVKERQ